MALCSTWMHIVNSCIEHPSVLNTCRGLEKEGFRVTYLPVDADGSVSPEDVRAAVCPDTVLVSVMAANNEIGTLQPVREIGEICRAKGVVFHTDAVQAAGLLKIDVKELNADLLSISAHKFHGPKGTGALYVRRGTRLEPLVRGGEQERGLRAGTENVPCIVGLGKALEIAAAEREENAARIRELRDILIRRILERVPGARLNGHPERRLPNNCHFSFTGIESEALLLRLDLAGIAVSGGSACTAGSMEPSHVLQAIGLKDDLLKSGVRLTLGRETRPEDIEKAAQILPEIVEDLRRMRGIG